MGGGIWFLSDDFYCNFYPIILHHLPIPVKICLVLLLKVSKHAKLDAQHAKIIILFHHHYRTAKPSTRFSIDRFFSDKNQIKYQMIHQFFDWLKFKKESSTVEIIFSSHIRNECKHDSHWFNYRKKCWYTRKNIRLDT